MDVCQYQSIASSGICSAEDLRTSRLDRVCNGAVFDPPLRCIRTILSWGRGDDDREDGPALGGKEVSLGGRTARVVMVETGYIRFQERSAIDKTQARRERSEFRKQEAVRLGIELRQRAEGGARDATRQAKRNGCIGKNSPAVGMTKSS